MPLDGEARVGVLGAGAMGSGIAQVAATNGHTVVIADADAGALERARSSVEGALRREVDKGRLDRAGADSILSRIRYHAAPVTGPLDPFTDCAIVIEAIVERLDIKQQTFARLESAVSADCVLATNTSSLPIAGIASACARPDRVVGAHFFNPAPVMPLVEIIPWLRTALPVTAGTRALIDGWSKVTVLATDTPGFIVNRIARPFYGEGLRIFDEGIADASTVDWAMRELGGFRMGPFELMDLIGHDVNFAVTRSVFDAFFFDRRYTPSITQQRLVEAGMLGRKSGRGFYEYGDGSVRPQPSTDHALGMHVFERILVMLINEAVDAVYWRVASPADIDLAVRKGVNYPKGLLAWGEEWGWKRVLDRLASLQEEYGEDRYRPSVLLKRIVREGRHPW